MPGDWHHVVATIEAIGGIGRLYVDGVEEVTFTPASRPPHVDGFFAIGVETKSAGTQHPFHGHISEVAIYDKVLSVERVAAHFSAGR